MAHDKFKQKSGRVCQQKHLWTNTELKASGRAPVASRSWEVHSEVRLCTDEQNIQDNWNLFLFTDALAIIQLNIGWVIRVEVYWVLHEKAHGIDITSIFSGEIQADREGRRTLWLMPTEWQHGAVKWLKIRYTVELSLNSGSVIY